MTSFEIFFDLVFVFAITRVISFMTDSLTVVTLAQGLILLLLLWWSWSAYAWLGNQARADQGLIQLGMIVVMAALLIAGLVMPDAWGGDRLDAPLILALSLAAVRVVYTGLYLYVAASDRRLRAQVLFDAIPQSVAWIAFIVGALIGGAAQTVLWATAVAIDFGGGWVTSTFRGHRLQRPAHFAERHALVLILALGESLVAVDEATRSAISGWLELAAGALSFVAAVCLYLLYFARTAEIAEQGLAHTPEGRRIKIARNGYTFAHLPMIAGILYVAVGLHEVLSHVVQGGSATVGEGLGWPAATALYAGAALYLAGRAAFVRLTVGAVTALPLLAAAGALMLLPAARYLSALGALGLVVALLAGLAGYEQLNGQRIKTAGGK